MVSGLSDLERAIPRALLPSIEPQLEQFGVTVRAVGDGVAGESRGPWGSARIWACSPWPSCLVVRHLVVMKRGMRLVEQATRGVCIALMSKASLELSPVQADSAPAPFGNVVAFGQEGVLSSSILCAGDIPDPTSISLLPEWGESAGLYGRDLRELAERPGSVFAGALSPSLRSTLSFADSYCTAAARRATPRGELRSLVRQAALLALECAHEQARAEQAADGQPQRALVRNAKAVIGARLDAPIPLDTLARELLTSRARLCAAFKRETGTSIGAYITRCRIDRACDLLSDGRRSVGEVARAVGYERHSSFTVAFEREVGCPPSAWRDATRR